MMSMVGFSGIPGSEFRVYAEAGAGFSPRDSGA